MGKKDELYRQKVEANRQKRLEEEAKRAAAARKKTLTAVIAVVCAVALIAGVAVLIWQPWKDDGNAKFTSSTSDKNNGSGSNTESSFVEDTSYLEDYEFSYDVEKKHHVEIEVENYGVIKVELDPTYAPVTVDNFLKLAESGFYDGLTFHRIMKNFMIQGGCPNGNGLGGSETKIKGEFSENGVKNPLSHKRGVISMARSNAMDSASSQFFICDADSLFLDGKYAAFGWVTEGMDVVDAIADDAKPTDGNGTIAKDDQPVITKITVID